MAKNKTDQPGLDIPLPGKELRPHLRNPREGHGVLNYVQPVSFVGDMGAPRDTLTDWRGTKSPASAQFVAGVAGTINPSPKTEEQSGRIQTGVTASERRKKHIEP